PEKPEKFTLSSGSALLCSCLTSSCWRCSDILNTKGRRIILRLLSWSYFSLDLIFVEFWYPLETFLKILISRNVVGHGAVVMAFICFEVKITRSCQSEEYVLFLACFPAPDRLVDGNL